MKTHYLNRSLLVLILSSSALVAAAPSPGIGPELQAGSSALRAARSFVVQPVEAAPAQRASTYAGTPAVAPIGVLTERDAGTPISIPLNGKFRLSLHTDSKVDPVGSFWKLANNSYQNMQLVLRDQTTSNWFHQGSESQVSNVFFAYKPLVTGQTELSFELVQSVPVASGSVNANGPVAGDFTVIRTLSFPVTVVDADNGSVSMEPVIEPVHQSGARALAGDLSSGSW